MPSESKPKVYISGALTGVPNIEELKKFYEAIAGLCAELGFEPYVPHLHSDPLANPDMSPAEVDRLDRDRVQESEFTLLYAGVPSFGPGIEIEIANKANRSAAVFYEKGRRVSRLLLGNPAVKTHFAFADFKEALLILRTLLLTWKRNWDKEPQLD